MTEASGFSPRRGVRSYTVRSRRLKPSKARTMARLYPAHGINLEADAHDWDEIFPGASELHVEIGIGSGEALADFAKANPQAGIVGFEVYPFGVASALARIEAMGLGNAKVALCDATERMSRLFSTGSLSGTRIFFPDPWRKKRHHKRRLVNGNFVAASATLTRAGGRLHFSSDWKGYADETHALLADSGHWEVLSYGSGERYRFGRTATRFERRGIKEGREPWDLVAERIG